MFSWNDAIMQPINRNSESNNLPTLNGGALAYTCHSSPVSLTCHPCRDSGRLPPTNSLYRRSTSPRRQTGTSGFRRKLLEQSSITRDLCTVACSDSVLKHFLFHLSYPDLVIWLRHYCFFNCRPCDNCCYLGHNKNTDDDDDDDMMISRIYTVIVKPCPHWQL